MGLATRTLGGCVALACAASLAGGTSVPILERASSPSPGGMDVASLGGPSDTPPEQQSPSDDVRVSVTEIETEVEVVDSDGSVIGQSGSLGDFSAAAGATGIPAMVLAAYQAAAERIATEDPSCGLQWQVLAGIGKIESSHARGGQLDSAGVNVPRIIGPVLNGGPGVAAISDSDGGSWDGDAVWDRAVGPMQFIPGTWRGYGADADGDGVSDPHNVWDATLAAGRYLCAGGEDLRTPSGLRSALYRYNHSASYVNHVMSWINAYFDGAPIPTPDRGPGDPDDTGSDGNASREPEAPNVPKPGGNNGNKDNDGQGGNGQTPGRNDDNNDQDDPKDPNDPGDDPDPTVVPDLVGKKLAAAKAALSERGLGHVVKEQVVDDETRVGKVLKHNPGAQDEVKPGSKVTLTVGVAPPDPDPEPVVVPGLVGKELAAAKTALTELGLGVVVKEQVVDDEAQVGKVLKQNPSAGSEVAADAEVTLTVGAPAPDPEPVVVPNVVGSTQADATAALENLGLAVKVVEQEVENSDRVGKVLEQNPGAGSEVDPGAEVTLTVGVAPPPPEPVVVPNVVGDPQADAKSTLAELGLAVSVVEQEVDDESKVGTVLGQDPGAQEEVDPGAEVTLTIGVAPPPPEPVALPNLVDEKQADAETSLTDLGLGIEIVEQEVDDKSKAGRVLAQDPDPETKLEPGSTVTVTVGVRPE